MLAGWFGFALLVGGLLWADVRVGILAGLAGLVAAWLHRQRVPASHVAETYFYRRTLENRPGSRHSVASPR